MSDPADTPNLAPYDPDRPLRLRCACGQTHAAGAAPHCKVAAPVASVVPSAEARTADFMLAALVKALFPQEPLRRAFLRAVGSRTAAAAVASLVPMAPLMALAQERRPLEKTDLKIGFLPITCATPLVAADPLGFYAKEGLKVSLNRTAGWAVVRDKTLAAEFDASHMLSPMPLAITLGLGAPGTPMVMPAIENVNGNAITLHVKHKDRRDPKTWKGFKFAVPFEYSMHNFLLRYYVAEAGLNPDTDIQIRVTPPPEMVANLRAGNIDGFLGPDPFNQRAVYDEVGFIHVLSKEIWDGHPCCAFGLSDEFIRQNPATYAALFRSVLTAAAMARDPKNRELIAKVISPAAYLNQPETVVAQVLTGKFADGLGGVKTVPDRADFDPIPWQSMAVWMMTQMKRWGYIKGDVNYRQIAEKVFLLTDARKYMTELGQKAPSASAAYQKFKIMGREFDPARAEEYARSFPISKMAG